MKLSKSVKAYRGERERNEVDDPHALLMKRAMVVVDETSGR